MVTGCDWITITKINRSPRNLGLRFRWRHCKCKIYRSGIVDASYSIYGSNRVVVNANHPALVIACSLLISTLNNIVLTWLAWVMKRACWVGLGVPCSIGLLPEPVTLPTSPLVPGPPWMIIGPPPGMALPPDGRLLLAPPLEPLGGWMSRGKFPSVKAPLGKPAPGVAFGLGVP